MLKSLVAFIDDHRSFFISKQSLIVPTTALRMRNAFSYYIVILTTELKSRYDKVYNKMNIDTSHL